MISTQTSCTDINESGLIHFDTAKKTILDALPRLHGTQQVPIEQATGRCLAESIISPINVPAQTNSAVDGYALRGSELATDTDETSFTIQARVLAGQFLTEACLANHCVRIMTGAAMPNDLDTVIMQEHCQSDGNTIRIDARHSAGQNVRHAGEDIQQGELVLQQGKQLSPADIGLLASLGLTEIKVRRKLRIAIASTGDEVYSPASLASVGGLYDSNRYSLLAALDRADIELIDLGIIPDQEAELLKQFNAAASYADLIISSGGVSVGEADFTKSALKASGQINFWKIAIKPGRPLAFGKIQQSTFFGLPGNPVAVLVTFYQFVLPAIEKMLGINQQAIAPILKARSLNSIRKRAGRTEFPRGIVSQNAAGELQVSTTGKQGSGILSSMSIANAFIVLQHDRESIQPGEWVDVQLFSNLFH
ncbi:MAG: molybdopterin molybdenumtransferase MoeA [Methyloprofundus sp.]|nr:molybdopterin molybdenumtransferase MoeA [Methyloprofundus sp.]